MTEESRYNNKYCDCCGYETNKFIMFHEIKSTSQMLNAYKCLCDLCYHNINSGRLTTSLDYKSFAQALNWLNEQKAMTKNWNMQNRYLIFAGHQFYPNGGFNDIISALPLYDKETIIEYIENSSHEYDWCHVIDLDFLQIIFEGRIDDEFNRKWEWKDVAIV